MSVLRNYLFTCCAARKNRFQKLTIPHPVCIKFFKHLCYSTGYRAPQAFTIITQTPNDLGEPGRLFILIQIKTLPKSYLSLMKHFSLEGSRLSWRCALWNILKPSISGRSRQESALSDYSCCDLLNQIYHLPLSVFSHCKSKQCCSKFNKLEGRCVIFLVFTAAWLQSLLGFHFQGIESNFCDCSQLFPSWRILLTFLFW